MKDWQKAVDLTKPTLVIAPSHRHVTILESLNDLSYLPDFDLMTLESWRQEHTQSLKKEAHLHLIKAFQLSPGRLQDFNDLVPYLDAKTEDAFLKEVTADLKAQQLFFQPPWKDQPLKAQLVFIGYPHVKKIDQKILASVYSNHSITVIEDDVSDHIVPLYEHLSEYDEVVALAMMIAEQVSRGTCQLQQIKVHIPAASYETLIPLIFPRFHVPYQILTPVSLWDYPMTKEIYQTLQDEKGSTPAAIDRAFAKLKTYKAHPLKRKITAKLVRVFGDYYLSDQPINEILPYILAAFKAEKITPPAKTEGVTFAHLLKHPIQPDDVVYVLGVNEGYFPASVSFTSSFSDAVLRTLGKETLLETSKAASDEAYLFLHHPNLKAIFYSHKAFSEEKIPSSLIERLLGSKIVHQSMPFSPVRYSVAHDLLEVGKRHHAAMIYGTANEDDKKLAASVLKHTDYPAPTRHKDETLSASNVEKLLKAKPKTSYSKIEDYFKCEFRYLLKHLLDVEEDSDHRAARFMGSFVHEVLAEIDTLPEKASARFPIYHKIIKELAAEEEEPLADEETFYLENIFQSIDRYVDHVKTFHHQSMYEIFALEKRYDIALKGKYIQKMTGIVDKIMAYQDQFVIVDYKSSERSVRLHEYEYGLQSQLPFYVNIVEKHSDKAWTPAGFFYHPFTMKVPKKEDKGTPAEQEKKRWQMRGFIDPEAVALFDLRYDSQSFIQGMNVKANGEFYKTAKVLTASQLSALGDWLEEKVDEAIKHMETGSFKINPKGTVQNTPSCQYCQFKDICFKTADDYQAFTYDNDEDFIKAHLGADDDSG